MPIVTVLPALRTSAVLSSLLLFFFAATPAVRAQAKTSSQSPSSPANASQKSLPGPQPKQAPATATLEAEQQRQVGKIYYADGHVDVHYENTRLRADHVEYNEDTQVVLAHGNVQLSGTGALADLLCEEVKSKLGMKRVRGDTFGYLQRSFVGCVSKVDQREAREVGEKGVQYALQGAGDGSVAIRRVANYAVDYPLVPLETVAGKTRVMEDHFINAAGNDVTPAFYDYLRPLLGADVIEVSRLRGAKVDKAGVVMGDAT